jgi:hypothetical protein
MDKLEVNPENEYKLKYIQVLNENKKLHGKFMGKTTYCILTA